MVIKQRIGFSELRIAAAGQWERIHQSAGIVLQATSHRKHTPCPGCGGCDRFRVDKSYHDTGRWFCGGGGAFQQGDGFALLEHVFGWNPTQQLEAVKVALGLDTHMSEAQRAKLRKAARSADQERVKAVKLKEARLHNDCKILDSMAALEDAIAWRRSIHRATQRMYQPTPEEVAGAHALNNCLIESYRGLKP